MLSAKAANLLVVLQTFVSAVAALPPAPPILLFNHLNANVTLPQHLSAVTTPNDLPPDRWNYSIPGPGNRQVTFYNYGYPLNPPQETEVVIGFAYRDATNEHHASERIALRPLEYVQPGPGTHVMLSYYASPQTNWGEWANTVVGLEEFTFRWDNVAFNFALNIAGEYGPPLGLGSLKSVILA